MKTPQPAPLYDLNFDDNANSSEGYSESPTVQPAGSSSSTINTTLHWQLIRDTLYNVLEQTTSKYCFAAFINKNTHILTHLFMSNGVDFISQRTDNTNFKVFWEEAYLKNEPFIENRLPVQCTISTNNTQFHVLRYASIPVQDKNSTIIFILFNKTSDYSENDTLNATLCIEELIMGMKDENGMHSGNIHIFTASDATGNLNSEKLITSHRIESIGILAGGMAHDFNNYLTGIINFVNLAKFCTTSRQIELYLDNTLAIANDAQMLTKQFLKYSKNYEPAYKKILITSILKENISILVKGTNTKAELHVDENLNLCNVDEDKISQLFGSIIVNAREAMPEGGVIDISVTNSHVEQSEQLPLASGNYVKIQIRDNGCGISPEIMKNIFKPYFTTKPKRSGLGLASAMIIAENHFGYITVASEVNTGSTFTVYLPVANTPNLDTSSNENSRSQGKILVMDDEYYIRQTSSEILKKKHFEVSTAIQGNEAIELYKKAIEAGTPFSMVILDLTVPEGLGGIETLRKLQEINPGVKAIASSGYSDDPVIVQPEKFGFAGSLAKPYNLNEFLNCITSVLSKNN